MNNKNSDFLITEYSAISSYFNTVINFRFLIFGFFIAFIGVLISGDFNWLKAIFLLIVALFLWIIELRNRSLAKILIDREIQIENEWYKNNNVHKYIFHRLNDGEASGGVTRIFGKPILNIALLEYEENKVIKYFPNIKNKNTSNKSDKNYVYYLISHSFIFDAAYFLTVLFSFVYIFISLFFSLS
jgi:hypothetical protein